MTHGLPEQLRNLLCPEAYPHPVRKVELVETHISWILLTGELAYKIKRPVRYPFVDLRSAEHRAFLCHEELRLNRRFAPELYLDVCAITALNGEARIQGEGTVIDQAVKMRQFPRGDALERLLAEQRIEPVELTVFGRALAAIHAGLPVADPTQKWGRPETVRELVLDNLEQCVLAARVYDRQDEVGALREAFQSKLTAVAPCMSERFAGGKVRECHGDLHSGNVARYQSRLVAFDCLEFEPAFRWIDVADEVAFLLADLDAHGKPLHAQAFMGGYLAQSGDYQACRLLGLYGAHRALVRAKVSALSAPDSSGESTTSQSTGRRQFDAHLEAARHAFAPREPNLILMCGLSGSGKTWMASRIAPALGAVHLRSDVERKRLAAIGEHARSVSGLDQGLYSPEARRRVYEHLVTCARDVLTGGYTAIVDATFHLGADRARFAELAAQLRVPRFHHRLSGSWRNSAGPRRGAPAS